MNVLCVLGGNCLGSVSINPVVNSIRNGICYFRPLGFSFRRGDGTNILYIYLFIYLNRVQIFLGILNCDL